MSFLGDEINSAPTHFDHSSRERERGDWILSDWARRTTMASKRRSHRGGAAADEPSKKAGRTEHPLMSLLKTFGVENQQMMFSELLEQYCFAIRAENGEKNR